MDQYQFPSITLAATVKDQQNTSQDHVDSSILLIHHLVCTIESKLTTSIYQIYPKVSQMTGFQNDWRALSSYHQFEFPSKLKFNSNFK